eukprot:4597809-Pyramimonas_sp.AAC.1
MKWSGAETALSSLKRMNRFGPKRQPAKATVQARLAGWAAHGRSNSNERHQGHRFQGERVGALRAHEGPNLE